MKHRKERNWSHYNQKLKTTARIDFWISQEALDHWYYKGPQAQGGKIVYSDPVIELCLMMREVYQLAYRQTQGFVESILGAMGKDLSVPDYTTLSRRAGSLKVELKHKLSSFSSQDGMVVAIDSTGLSLYSNSHWHRLKYGRAPSLTRGKQWRKLHVAIDVNTGQILAGRYTASCVNDRLEMPGMVEEIEGPLRAVCADRAYDSLKCRRAVAQKGARQLIPPYNNARLAKDNRNIPAGERAVLKERDEAILYTRYNAINGDPSLARKSWKEKSGYHARSLVETTMFQLKSHCSDHLTNHREDTRATQALLRCKVINLIQAA